MRKIILILISFHLALASSYSQGVNEVLKKAGSHFTDSKPFQFNSEYSLYKDHNTNTVHQKYDGIFMKNAENDVYMKIDQTEFINTKKYSLKINHKQKAMSLSNNQVFSSGELDVNKLLQFCKISSYKDYKSFWQIVLTPKEFSGLNYSKIVLNVNKDFNIKEQIYYYNTNLNFSKDFNNQELSKPRLEIKYSNHNNNPVKVIDTDLYFKINKDNKPSVVLKYKAYEFSDLRTNTKIKNKPTN
jgi:hypothetical protein